MPPSGFDKFLGLLAPPVFPGDEARTRNASFLNVILLSALAIQVLAPVLWSGSLERRVTMTALWTATVLGALILMRRGFVRLASVIHLTSSWILVTLAVATCGGVRAPGFSAYLLVAGCAGMLLGWKAMAFVVAVSISTGAALMYAENAGLIDPSKNSDSLLSAWLTFSVIMAVVAVHIGLAMRTIGQTLRRLESELAERKRTEEKLRDYQQQLQSLSSRILLVEERQRRNFSQMLHDHIGQNLTYAKLTLSAMKTQAAAVEIREPLEDLLLTVQQMAQETRSLTYELSPPLLYEIGLDAALEWLSEHVQSRYGLQCQFEGSDLPEQLEIDVRVVLFQAARELLFNVVKHAKAKTAVVSCVRSAERVCLSIRDDGAGFDAAKVAASRGGFGLFNVRERLQFIGGEMEIESKPSSGSRVTLILPIKRA